MSTVSTTANALALATQLMQAAIQISQLITRAQSEGRELTVEELDSAAGGYDVARAKLVLAIAEARATGK